MNKKLPAFTLLELVVVMAIIGVLALLGFAAFSAYSNNTTLNESTGDAVLILSETQSMAKNNTLPKAIPAADKLSNTYYYVVEFTNTDILHHGVVNRYLFSKNVDTGAITSLAAYSQSSINTKVIGSISYGVNSQNVCVLFEALTGKIRTYTTASSCNNNSYVSLMLGGAGMEQVVLRVQLVNNGPYKTIYINPTQGNFGIQNE